MIWRYHMAIIYGKIRCMAKRKVTMLLPTETIEALKRMVEQGAARSQGAAVQEAVAEYAARRKQEWLRTEYEAAARDPAFLRM